MLLVLKWGCGAFVEINNIIEVKTSLGARHTHIYGSELVSNRHASRRHVTRSEVKDSFDYIWGSQV
jgi:hypothetical protein